MTSTRARAKWAHLAVGNEVYWDGGENEGRHRIVVIKKAGRHFRVVLEPVVEHLAAKIAVRVGVDSDVELPEGTESPDAAGDALIEKLGAVELGHRAFDEDTFTCPKMNTTLIASHLRIMHGIELQGLPITSEDEMMDIHNELHASPFHQPAYQHIHEGGE